MKVSIYDVWPLTISLLCPKPLCFFFSKKIHRVCELRQSSDSFHDCLLALPLVLSAHLSGKTPANSNSLAATDPDKGVCTDPVVVQVLL